MNKLKIAILGTRGIPNRYGGFEQLAEYLSAGLAERGHDPTVYNSSLHPYKKDKWKNVKIVHRWDPEKWLGTTGQFIYDLNCIRHAKQQLFDVLVFLGYTSSSVWRRFYPRRTVIISHMDGLEWKREKYSLPVRNFLKYAEKLAVKYSHHHIADSKIIGSYLHEKYKVSAAFLSYGAEIIHDENQETLKEYAVHPRGYYMIMARIEPENNIEMVLEAFHRSPSSLKMLVLGNTRNRFGKKLQNKYASDKRIIFAGACYDKKKIHLLRFFSALYFHGHSAGGTNPSLLEAMGSRAMIAAHDNPFNREVLGENALYFTSVNDITKIIDSTPNDLIREKMINNNLNKIIAEHSWDAVTDQYEQFIVSCYEQSRS